MKSARHPDDTTAHTACKFSFHNSQRLCTSYALAMHFYVLVMHLTSVIKYTWAKPNVREREKNQKRKRETVSSLSFFISIAIKYSYNLYLNYKKFFHINVLDFSTRSSLNNN